MNKFFVHQLVIVGPGADNSVGCIGRVVNVGEAICEVCVEAPGGSYTGAFLKTDLIVESRGPMNPESAINDSLAKILRESKQREVVMPDAGSQQSSWSCR